MKNYEEQEKLKEEDFVKETKKLDKKITEREKTLRNFQRFIFNVFILLFILWFLFYCIIGLISAPTNDMHPKVEGSDLVLYYRLNKMPNINDIVVIHKNKTHYLARVIARGGDTVEIVKTGGVKVNGNSIVESNIYEGTLPREGRVDYPLTLKDNQYFVLVDSREDGEDSRFFGAVERSELKGVVVGLFRRTNL